MEQDSSATKSKSEKNSMGNFDDKKREDDKMESEIELGNKKVTNAAGSQKREESMCEASSTRNLPKCGTGEDEVKADVDEVKSGEVEEDENTVGKASLQVGDPQPKVAEEPPDTEDEEADSDKKSDNLAALDGNEGVGLRGSSVRKVWGRESFSPVREVWGEEGFNERDDEEEEQEDKDEVENQNEGRSIGKRNLRK